MNFWYKLFLIKAYFDKGWSWTNQFKYVLAFGGIFEVVSLTTAVWTILIYLIFCFLLGWFAYNYGLVDTENEVQNHYNPFQKEVRKKLKNKTFK